MSDAVTVALITLAGTVLSTIVTSIGNRKALSSKIDGVDSKLDAHIKEDAKANAVTCRTRIVRFCNDVRKGTGYDKEFWDSVMRDITEYKQFCKDNPDFPNEVCLHSISFLERKYDELMNTNGFDND